MAKYKAIYVIDEKKRENVGVFDERQEAVDALMVKSRSNYCLEQEIERRSTLDLQDYCICGCGPSMLIIEEVEC